jgi:hypothetical protein
METLNSKTNMQELDLEEMRNTQGGGFAYDAGTAIRFGWLYFTEGIANASADYAINKVLCNC